MDIDAELFNSCAGQDSCCTPGFLPAANWFAGIQAGRIWRQTDCGGGGGGVDLRWYSEVSARVD